MAYSEEPVRIPGRGPTKGYPIFRCYNHPLASETTKRVFVIYMDTTESGMNKLWEWEASLAVPYQEEDKMTADGWFKVGPGDLIFAACLRVNETMRRPALDIPKVWFSGRSDFTDEQINDMDDAQSEALGPREERTLEKPTLDAKTGTPTGGAAIERSPRNWDPARAHTIGPTRETQRNVIAPPASGKLKSIGAELDENLLIRKKVIKAGAAITNQALNGGPPQTVENIRMYSDIHNHLRLGSHESKAFSTMQLNLSGAKKLVGSMADMGRVGSAHFDDKDCKGLFTTTLSWSDMPDDYEPGLFFLLFAGVYMRMEKHLAFTFSGLHKHGGSAPTAPEGKDVKGWETRFVVVSYPQDLMFNGSVRLPLFANPNNLEAVYLNPEMHDPENHKDKFGKTRRSTYAKDSASLTDREEMFNFFARSTSQVVNHACLQMDPGFQIQFNLDLFMKCLNYVDVDGVRRTASPWPLGLGWRPKGALRESDQRGEPVNDLESTREFRATTSKRLEAHEQYMAQFIPRCVALKKVPALMGNDVDALIATASPSDLSCSTFSVGSWGEMDEPVTMILAPKSKTESEKAKKPQEGKDEEEEKRFKPSKEFLLLVDDKGNGAAVDAFNAKELKKLAKREEMKQRNRDKGKGQRVEKGTGKKRKRNGNSDGKRKRCKGLLEDDVSSSRCSPESEDDMDTPPQSPSPTSCSLGTSSPSVAIDQPSPVDRSNDQGVEKGPNGDSDGKGKKRKRLWEDDISSARTSPESAGATQSSSSLGTSPPSVDISRPFPSWDALEQEPSGERHTHPVAHSITKALEAPSVSRRGHGLDAPVKPQKAYPVLQKLSFDHVSRELRRVQGEAQLSRRIGNSKVVVDDPSYHVMMSEIESVDLSSTDRRMNVEMLAWAVKSTRKARHLKGDQAALAFAARGRRIVMLQHCLQLAEWLYECVITRRDRVFDLNSKDVDVDERWLHSLCKDAMSFATLRNGARDFMSSTYGVLGSHPPRVCSVTRRHPLEVKEEDARKMAKGIVLQVILSWVECDIDLWRLCAVRIIVHHLGIRALVLDGTWDVCMAATSHAIFKQYSPKYQFEMSSLLDFQNALEVMANGTDWHRTACYADTIYKLVIDDNDPAKQVGAPRDNPRDFFLAYVQEVLVVFPEDVVGRHEATAIQHNILNDPDKFLPFRECTPSFYRMRGPSGPYHGDTPRTTAGLFSSIIWRTVTWRSPFSELDKMVFNNLDEWNKAISLSREKGYICKGNQYGSSSQKNPKQVVQYWESVCELKWESRVQKNPKQTFMDVFDLLHPARGKQPFPQLGPLGAFHVVSDLVLCKIVEKPSSEDVGKCISIIDAGSASGVECILGCEKGKKKMSPERCTEGVKVAFEILNSSLTEAEKELIGLDNGPMIEHALCKFSRVWRA